MEFLFLGSVRTLTGVNLQFIFLMCFEIEAISFAVIINLLSQSTCKCGLYVQTREA